ncbi:MAG: hypothetical protein ACI8PB_000331 [Desulforhopalus sp.]|jgi:hypothetical protein
MVDDVTKCVEIASNSSNDIGVYIAAFAFLVSVISLYVSVRSMKIQRRHNVLSVRPLPEVTVASYENSLRVRIRNNGNGPLIIKSFIAKKGGIEKPSVIEWMEKLQNNRLWTHFATDINNRSVLPGKHIPLLELTELDGEVAFAENRDLCRSWLEDIECFVEYSDVYESKFPLYKKKLDWFKSRTRKN